MTVRPQIRISLFSDCAPPSALQRFNAACPGACVHYVSHPI